MHQVDVLFWLAPPPWVQQTIGSLLDGGVPLVIWADGKTVFPRMQYRLDVDQPFAEAYALWQTAGIQSAVVFQKRRPGSDPYETQVALRGLQRRELPHTIHRLASDEFPAAVHRLAADKSVGVVLPSHQDYQRWALRHADVMAGLLQSHRVLLGQNPFCHPAYEGRALCADVVHDFDPDPAARRIARDLVQIKTWQHPGTLATFRNRFTPRYDLGQASPAE